MFSIVICIKCCFFLSTVEVIVPDACVNETTIYKCITDTGVVRWEKGISVVYTPASFTASPSTLDDGFFTVELVQYNKRRNELISTATINNVDFTDDGRFLTCYDGFSGSSNNKRVTVNIIMGRCMYTMYNCHKCVTQGTLLKRQ